MKKLAIVSSYNELCGNATYTKVLRDEFAKYFSVDVLPLKVNWLVSSNKALKKLAEKHIDELAILLREYDYVNIQFEAGLYGSYPETIIRRIKKLIDNSNNLIFTMHRVDIKKSIFDKEVLRRFLSKKIFINLKQFRQENYFSIIYKKIVCYLKKKAINKNIQIIVHTQRDLDTIKYVYDFKNVHAFPLTFLNKDQLVKYPKISNKKQFCNTYNISNEDKIIGLFGFISNYKGHDTAIKALKLLPADYKIMIFGSQHPMTITSYEKVNPYIFKLMQLVESEKLNSRVIFAGSLSDEEFIKALYCCNFAVLPYLEVNQGGSGIASLVIETKIKSLFSNSLAFGELKKFFPDCFISFDIGNYHELAYKILNYKCDFRANIDKCLEKYNIENNILLYKALFEKVES